MLRDHVSLILLVAAVSILPAFAGEERPGQERAAGIHSAQSGAVTVDLTPSHVLNTINPQRLLGAGVDSVPAGAVAKIYTDANLKQMLAAGHGSVSYRLYTELSVQDWHWNPSGAWSDAASNSGYFTGSATPGDPILVSSGYRLPHRGTTHDQGNDDDDSRLTDGDKNTYWKSNPYLSHAFTGEDDSAHPQWIVLDLGKAMPVNAIHIDWANPYAVSYQVQYWTGDDAINDPGNGQWTTFANGNVANGVGGSVTLKLDDAPQSVQFVRVLMTQSSGTCDSHGGNDPRNCAGFAIAELGAGKSSDGIAFTDYVKHGTSAAAQTLTYASSCDPWHDATAQVTDQEQPGLDRVFMSGLTHNLPAAVPVPMLYSTPENAAAEIAYLEARGYPLAFVELGEEPDGQYMLPEDYAALYLQFASALHAVDPNLKLAGPVLQSTDEVKAWPDAQGNTSWVNRFIQYVQQHNRLSDLNAFTFEHYPFDSKDGNGRKGFAAAGMEPARAAAAVKQWRADGVPANVPIYSTEYNFSSDNTEAMQDITGALFHANFVGAFLSAGGNGAWYYEYEPTPPSSPSERGGRAGSFGMFLADDNYTILYRTSQFYSTLLLMTEWFQPFDAGQQLFAATNMLMSRGSTPVSAYAVLRPDGQWAVLLVNTSPNDDFQTTIDFKNSADGSAHAFDGTVTQVTFGSAQYVFHGRKKGGAPKPNDPPQTTTIAANAATIYALPRASITIVRGNVR